MSKNKKPKRLILLRHAHRDKKFGGLADNGLSKKGIHQAERIKRHYLACDYPSRAVLLSSPRARCVETLIPLADELGLLVEHEELLLEGLVSSRTKSFLKWWKSEAPALTIACSHGDWIPEFLYQVLGMKIELEKGGWVELELDGDKVTLTKLLQDLSFA